MADDALLRLLVALAVPAERTRVSAELARHLGADELLVMIEDPELSVMLPAPGWPQTLRDAAALREALAHCKPAGIHRRAVLGRPMWAIATGSGVAAVILGGAPAQERLEELALVLPLLACALRAELSARIAEGTAATARDASRRAHELASALDVTRGQLEAASRAKDEFLAMLGHELRNPLAPILTALALMKMRGDEHLRDERAVIERQIHHVVQLVDDLLDVSRITRGKTELRRETLRIRDVLTSAAEMAMPLIEERRHRLHVEVDAGLYVDGDARRLAQVVSNLLNNAAKYTPDGGEITLRAARDRDQAVINVRDNGVGMSADLVPRVFELFTQAPQAADRARGGLGLGLAIVRSLVELHGGSVTARSEGPGRGSELTVRLPTVAAPSESKRAPAPAPTPSPSARRILVVDDNEDAAWLLTQLLESFGHEVQMAHDGPAALALLERFVPEVALLDIGLPVMDGFELARLVAARVPGVKLVAVTGYGQADDREATRSAGFSAHLVKPVDIDDVVRLLAQPR